MNKNLVTIIVLVVIAAGAFFLIKYKFGNSEITPSHVPLSKPVVKAMTHPTLDKYLADSEGITLYVFSKDETTEGPLISKCRDDDSDDCARTWPPYLYDYNGYPEIRNWRIDTITQKMNLFERNTGAFQYAYGRKPVYYYLGDEKPGEVNGHGFKGFKGTWSVIFLKDQ